MSERGSPGLGQNERPAAIISRVLLQHVVEVRQREVQHHGAVRRHRIEQEWLPVEAIALTEPAPRLEEVVEQAGPRLALGDQIDLALEHGIDAGWRRAILTNALMRLVGSDFRPCEHGRAELLRLLCKPSSLAKELPRTIHRPFAHRLPPTAMDYTSFSYNRRVFVYSSLAARRATRYEICRIIARARDKNATFRAKCATKRSHQGRNRRLGDRGRPGGPCPDPVALQAVLRRVGRLWRRAQRPCFAGRCRHARDAAGDQRLLRRAGGADRSRAQGHDQPALGVRPQELFLSRPAAGLSDLAVQAAGRGGGGGDRRPARRRQRRGRDRAAPSRAGCRQIAPRPAPWPQLRRSQPVRRRADGDRVAAGPALGRGGQGLCQQAAHHHALSRHLRRQHGGGLAAGRRQCLGAPSRASRSGRAARSRM